jgi:RNA polymerase sigma-70 factor, ECF subfamily
MENANVALDFIRRVRSGDQIAFREMVERYQAKVYSIVFRILRDREDAEDIAQQAFTKVYFAMGSFDPSGSLVAWICRIAINECYSHLRKSRAKLAHETGLSGHEMTKAESQLSADRPGLASTMAKRDYLNKLLACIPQEDRLLIILKEVEGHSIGELAEISGLTAGVVKVRLFRARRRLVAAAGNPSLPNNSQQDSLCHGSL